MITKAFIYKVQDYQETSKLLFVFSPYGKYTLVAKGVKNFKHPNFHLSDSLNMIEVELNPTKSIQTLKQAKLIDSFDEMKKDYNKIKYGQYIGLLIHELVFEIEINERLFVLLEEIITYDDMKLAYITFLIKLTYVLGITLSFEKGFEGFDLKTGKTTDFNSNLNKVETTYLMLLYYTKEEVSLPEEIKETLFKFIKKYYLYHLEYSVKS